MAEDRWSWCEVVVGIFPSPLLNVPVILRLLDHVPSIGDCPIGILHVFIRGLQAMTKDHLVDLHHPRRKSSGLPQMTQRRLASI
jgi:hypothetical protein